MLRRTNLKQGGTLQRVRGAGEEVTCTECGGGSQHGFKRGLCPACYERARRRARGAKPRVRGTCSRDDCDRPHYGKGECEPHYRETVRRAKGIGPRAPRQVVECSHKDCTEPTHGRGLCRIHYSRDYYRRNAGTIARKAAGRQREPKRTQRTVDEGTTTVHWPRWGEDGTWTCPVCGETFRQEEVAA